MDKVIIAVDLGHFKAFRLTQKELESPRVKLIESYDSIEAHGKLSEKLSDSAGRFGVGGGKNGAAKGYGEIHNIELEMKKKAIKLIAKDILAILKNEGNPKWYLAADKGINSQVLDCLTKAAKAKMEKNVAADLTKKDKSEIINYFNKS